MKNENHLSVSLMPITRPAQIQLIRFRMNQSNRFRTRVIISKQDLQFILDRLCIQIVERKFRIEKIIRLMKSCIKFLNRIAKIFYGQKSH